jgi:uncharacterized cupredoxin-like copper-binding protein
LRLPLLAILAYAAAALAVSACGGDALANDMTVSIHYSHFTPETLTVAAGEPLTITLENDDPIEHEWIVGTEEVHQRHRTGTEPFHAEIPTEVTVPAFSTRVTQLTFTEAGEYHYICHLPGHEEYGMVGTLTVVD